MNDKINEYVKCINVDKNDPLLFNLDNLSGDTIKRMRKIFNNSDYSLFEQPCLYIADALMVSVEENDKQGDDEFNICHFICTEILKLTKGENPVDYYFALKEDEAGYDVIYKKENKQKEG